MKNYNINWKHISTGVCLTQNFSTNNTARMYAISAFFQMDAFRPDSGCTHAIDNINSLGFNELLEKLEMLSLFLYPLEIRRKNKLNKI